MVSISTDRLPVLGSLEQPVQDAADDADTSAQDGAADRNERKQLAAVVGAIFRADDENETQPGADGRSNERPLSDAPEKSLHRHVGSLARDLERLNAVDRDNDRHVTVQARTELGEVAAVLQDP